MKKLNYIFCVFTLCTLSFLSYGQDQDRLRQVERLNKQKERIRAQEKDALKLEVEAIAQRLKNGEIDATTAQELKEAVAKKRALNIENRLAIIENRIALLERNEVNLGEEIDFDSISEVRIGIDINGKPAEEFIFGKKEWKRKLRYDRRTYSDFVIAVGLNNALVEGESLDDSPYRIGGSRFFEMGWQWRTRVFKNSNFLRLNYGFSFQFNGLRPKGNRVFVANGDQTELQEFPFELNKSKLRMDNLVFPLHFEFGPSKFRKTERTIRYDLDRQFRVGLGGYGGFNIGTRQKLKFIDNGERIKEKSRRDFNTADLIYGISGYVGVGGTQLYLKYDLNPIFMDAEVEQRNISLGLRFDL